MLLEVGKPGGSIQGIHDVQMNMWKCANRTFLVPLHMVTNALIHHFIRLFTGSISFRVIGRQWFKLHAFQFVRGGPEFGNEKFIMVGYV